MLWENYTNPEEPWWFLSSSSLNHVTCLNLPPWLSSIFIYPDIKTSSPCCSLLTFLLPLLPAPFIVEKQGCIWGLTALTFVPIIKCLRQRLKTELYPSDYLSKVIATCWISMDRRGLLLLCSCNKKQIMELSVKCYFSDLVEHFHEVVGLRGDRRGKRMTISKTLWQTNHSFLWTEWFCLCLVDSDVTFHVIQWSDRLWATPTRAYRQTIKKQ